MAQWIAANVRRLRMERGLTQEQLAESAGITVRTVQVVESGKHDALARTVLAIADGLQVGIEELFVRSIFESAKPGRPARARRIDAHRKRAEPE